EDKIATIVERVVKKLAQGETAVPLKDPPAPVNPPYGCDPLKRDPLPARGGGGAALANAGGPLPKPHDGRVGRGVFTALDAAVAAARAAFDKLTMLGLKARYDIVAEIRREAYKHVDAISRMAVEETGLGRVDQKVLKNKLVIDKTPGPEILEPWAQSGDD